MDPKRPARPGFGPTPLAKPGQPGQRPGMPAASGGPSAPSRAPALGDTLDQLNREIRQLQIEYEKFFNGALPTPPEELRSRIQTQIRNLRNLKITSTMDNYRLGDVEARFNSSL